MDPEIGELPAQIRIPFAQAAPAGRRRLRSGQRASRCGAGGRVASVSRGTDAPRLTQLEDRRRRRTGRRPRGVRRGSTKSTSTQTTTTTTTISATDQWGTTWLCRPGLSEQPVPFRPVTTTSFRAERCVVSTTAPATSPPVDCFYVYPTISGETTINASLAVGFREQEVAIAQASRVLPGLPGLRAGLPADHAERARPPARGSRSPTRSSPTTSVARGVPRLPRSLQRRPRDRLHRPLAGRDDPDPAAPAGGRQAAPRCGSRLVSALLIGGNVTVPKGKTVGGDFKHIPACTLGARDRLRRRLLELHLEAAAGQPVRPHDLRRRRAPARAAARRSPSLADHVRQPRLAVPAGRRCLDPYIPSLALTFLSGQHALGDDAVGLVPARVHRPLQDLGQRDLAAGHAGRAAAPTTAQRSRGLQAADPRAPRPRREHRARQSRQPRRPSICGLQSPLTTQ